MSYVCLAELLPALHASAHYGAITHRYVCLAELLPTAFLEKGVSKDLVTAAFFGG